MLRVLSLSLSCVMCSFLFYAWGTIGVRMICDYEVEYVNVVRDVVLLRTVIVGVDDVVDIRRAMN